MAAEGPQTVTLKSVLESELKRLLLNQQIAKDIEIKVFLNEVDSAKVTISKGSDQQLIIKVEELPSTFSSVKENDKIKFQVVTEGVFLPSLIPFNDFTYKNGSLQSEELIPGYPAPVPERKAGEEPPAATTVAGQGEVFPPSGAPPFAPRLMPTPDGEADRDRVLPGARIGQSFQRRGGQPPHIDVTRPSQRIQTRRRRQDALDAGSALSSEDRDSPDTPDRGQQHEPPQGGGQISLPLLSSAAQTPATRWNKRAKVSAFVAFIGIGSAIALGVLKVFYNVPLSDAFANIGLSGMSNLTAILTTAGIGLAGLFNAATAKIFIKANDVNWTAQNPGESYAISIGGLLLVGAPAVAGAFLLSPISLVALGFAIMPGFGLAEVVSKPSLSSVATGNEGDSSSPSSPSPRGEGDYQNAAAIAVARHEQRTPDSEPEDTPPAQRRDAFSPASLAPGVMVAAGYYGTAQAVVRGTAAAGAEYNSNEDSDSAGFYHSADGEAHSGGEPTSPRQ